MRKPGRVEWNNAIRARLARWKGSCVPTGLAASAEARMHAPARGMVPRIRRTAADDAVNRVIHATKRVPLNIMHGASCALDGDLARVSRRNLANSRARPRGMTTEKA